MTRPRIPSLTAALLVISTGCTVVEDNFAQQVDATGVWLVDAQVDGDFSYGGSPGATVFTVAGTSSGLAADGDLAAEREADNQWDVSVRGDTLSLWSSAGTMSEVDFMVSGPERMNIGVTASGDVDIQRVTGQLVVSADDIYADGIIGSAELLASDDVVLAISPTAGDRIYIESTGGDVDLTLAYGPGYDIQIWSDADQPMSIADFGFHSMADGPGYFAAVAGNGQVRVDVVAPDGQVHVHQAW